MHFFLSPLTISALALCLKLWPFEVGLTGSIGVFLGLEVEPPQHFGLLRAAKGCQMTASHNPVTPVGRYQGEMCVLFEPPQEARQQN